MAFCPSGGAQPLDEGVAQIGLHVRMPDQIYQHEAGLVEQPSLALTSWDLRRQTAREQPPLKGASMDMKTLAALSGVMGTLVGVSATVAIAWITQKTLNRRDLV
jgi:hypothetical protein